MSYGPEDASQSFTGSAAALASKTSDTVKVNPVDEVMKEKLARDGERQRKWFDCGVRAKQRGYGDLSPFYENATADYFFKCGYNGTSFAEAQETLTAKIKNFLEQDSTVLETVNELAK
jgi:hypothetical protein